MDWLLRRVAIVWIAMDWLVWTGLVNMDWLLWTGCYGLVAMD